MLFNYFDVRRKLKWVSSLYRVAASILCTLDLAQPFFYVCISCLTREITRYVRLCHKLANTFWGLTFWEAHADLWNILLHLCLKDIRLVDIANIVFDFKKFLDSKLSFLVHLIEIQIHFFDYRKYREDEEKHSKAYKSDVFPLEKICYEENQYANTRADCCFKGEVKIKN